MGSLESTGETSLGFTKIEIAVESLRRSDIFHVVKEVLGFILYMHQQIPTVLQHLEHEFDGLKKDYKQLEVLHSAQLEMKERKASKKTNMRRIEVKSAIKKLEKLINSLSTLFSALQEAIDGIPGFQGVTFLLGGSLARPHHVYEIFFSHFKILSDSANHNAKSKVAENLSRKIISTEHRELFGFVSVNYPQRQNQTVLCVRSPHAVRALVSNGAGSSSFSGPTKLFLLIKSPCSFKSPLHFLPKRDFRYNKKVVPIKLHIKYKVGEQTVNYLHCNPDQTNPSSSADTAENDMIWYQCRHIVRGLAVKSQETEF